MPATVFEIRHHARSCDDPAEIAAARHRILSGEIGIVRNAFPAEWLREVRDYLVSIGRNTLPNYHPFSEGCPNFHRVNRRDSRAHVGGSFHQFNFFPWNQDVFDLFARFQSVFHTRNLLSEIPREKFLATRADSGCFARLGFQFYPRGEGSLNRHRDPVGYHQSVVATLQMSTKGIDFQRGGAYLETGGEERILLDDVTECGDLIYYDASLPHGVETIDPGEPCRWLRFEGRWMLLLAVNKLATNFDVDDAKELKASTDG